MTDKMIKVVLACTILGGLCAGVFWVAGYHNRDVERLIQKARLEAGDTTPGTQ